MEQPVDGTGDFCQACGTSKRADPTLKFKLSRRCYHRVCTNCLEKTYRQGGRQTCPTKERTRCTKDMFKNDWRDQTFEDVALEREIDIRRRVAQILDRREEEFESKRAYDDFLELREELIMNLTLKTDVAATNRKLTEYQTANGLKIDRELQDALETKAKGPKRKLDTTTDRSGLIKGLRKVAPVKVIERYDPFQGMAVEFDYFTLSEDYDTGYNDYKKENILAGGYDFQDALGESLLRAFAGFGVFIDDEKAQAKQHVPDVQSADTPASDDVF